MNHRYDELVSLVWKGKAPWWTYMQDKMGWPAIMTFQGLTKVPIGEDVFPDWGSSSGSLRTLRIPSDFVPVSMPMIIIEITIVWSSSMITRTSARPVKDQNSVHVEMTELVASSELGTTLIVFSNQKSFTWRSWEELSHPVRRRNEDKVIKAPRLVYESCGNKHC